jgi:hypothetical protein
MALVNRYFYQCCNPLGSGAPIYKTFEIDTAGTWTANVSTVIYTGDGSCYYYTATPSVDVPLQSFATQQYSTCPSCNAANPNGCYYTFSACCDGSTFSLRRGDFSFEDVYGTLTVGDIWQFTVNLGGVPNIYAFRGCASYITGVTGNTIYATTGSTTIAASGPGAYIDCNDCLTIYPCCVSGTVDNILCSYTDCCDTFVSGGTIADVVCFNPYKPHRGLATPYTDACSQVCPTPTPTPTITVTPTVTPTPGATTTPTPTVTTTPTPTPTVTPTNTNTPTNTVTPTNTITTTVTPTVTPTKTTTNTPTVTSTSTVTPTNTPTVTSTPTITPTNTPTPSVTAGPTDYQFRACCNPTQVFVVDDYVGTVNLGETYYISSTGFTGCAEVIPYTGLGDKFVVSGLTGPYVDCDTCTADYNCYCQCKEYLIDNTQEYSAYISYYDCYGNEQNVIVPGLTELNICACEDTVIVPPGVILTLEGDCNQITPTPEATPTQTPTPSPTPVYGPCNTQFCLYTNFSGTSMYDGNYTSGGTYNGRPYWTGSTSGTVFYDGTKWCLGTTPGGTCILAGKSPCFSNCPDLDNLFWSEGPCPTPTPTPTTNVCLTVNFNAFFDCDYEPEPTVTCVTPTPTISVTPSPNPCAYVDADITVEDTTPTPTPTPTVTPTPSLQRNVNISGSTTYTINDTEFECIFVRKIQDCSDNEIYYVNQSMRTSGETIINTGQTFSAEVSGTTKCYTYLDIVYDQSPTLTFNTIIASYASCASCQNSLTPTPTPTKTVTPTVTPTPNVTPTNTATPTITPTTSVTSTPTPTVTKTATPTYTPNASPKVTPTVTKTPTVTPTSTVTVTPSVTITKTPTRTPRPTLTNTPTLTKTPTPTLTKTPTQTPTQTPTKTPRPNNKFLVRSCSSATEPIYAVSNGGLLPVTIGSKVKLAGTGYNIGCWEVIGTTLGGSATSIVSVHSDCTCS